MRRFFILTSGLSGTVYRMGSKGNTGSAEYVILDLSNLASPQVTASTPDLEPPKLYST
jgi:hypothetical protein